MKRILSSLFDPCCKGTSHQISRSGCHSFMAGCSFRHSGRAYFSNSGSRANAYIRQFATNRLRQQLCHIDRNNASAMCSHCYIPKRSFCSYFGSREIMLPAVREAERWNEDEKQQGAQMFVDEQDSAMSRHPWLEKYPKYILDGGMRIAGYSIGGQHSALVSPDFNVALDMGFHFQEAVRYDTVLISHGHMDHISGMASHAAARAIHRLSPPVFVVPPAIESRVRNMMAACRSVGNSNFRYQILPLQVGDMLQIRSNVYVRPFRTHHSVPSQGYEIVVRKRKLKPELHGLPQEELNAIRLAGREITQEIETVELAYTGDTSLDVFKTNPELLKCKRLLVECTFVEDEPLPEEARGWGHMHLQHILENAEFFENQHVGLIHLSCRYSPSSTIELMTSQLDQTSLRGRYSIIHPYTALGTDLGAKFTPKDWKESDWLSPYNV